MVRYSNRKPDIAHLIDNETPESDHDHLLRLKVWGLGAGPLEPEPVKRLSYEDYRQLKMMDFFPDQP